MTRLRVHNFTISLDGYGAGPDQRVDAPMGTGSAHLHDWFKRTALWTELTGEASEGSTGPDDALAREGDEGIGATLMGRNMFGPVRGPWPDESWTGWWGPEPPYGHHVFVVTHHPRRTLEVGATTFHFVADLQDAKHQAIEAADGLDVRAGGGVSVVQQLLALGQLDHIHLAIAPLLLGGGERLFADGFVVPEGYEIHHRHATEHAAHVVLTRRPGRRRPRSV